MKILKFQAQNIKRIKAVEITPEGNVVILTGKNGAGKSTVLDSIVYALCGKDSLPLEPLRRGSKNGSITLDLGGEVKCKVTRIFTESGTKLEVMDAGEKPVNGPQTFIDRFVGAISMDPTRFLTLSTREQRQMLLNLLKVDFSDIDSGIDRIKEERADLNREKKALEVNLAAMQFTDDLPDQEISVADLTAELRRRQDHNAYIQRSREFISDGTVEIQEKEGLKEDLEKRIADLQQRLDQVRREIATIMEEVEKEKEISKSLQEQDCDEILRQISDSQATNQKIRVNLKIAEINAKLEKVRSAYTEKGQTIEALEARKQTLLAEARMPVEGLSADDSGLLYRGVPLSQASESEKLRVSVAIAMALNPTLRVIRASANAFDSESLKIISEMATANDYQIWLEKVDESGKVGFVIEDGTVKREEN